MPTLREIQLACSAALLDPGRGHRVPAICADGMPAMQRLAVYRNSIFQNYRRALATTYPAIEALVGAGCFTRLSQEYARRHRSRSGDVGRHAAHFPGFLAAHPFAREHPYLPDVARLEWAIETCFGEADDVPLAPLCLAGVAPEAYGNLHFRLSPALRLLHASHPVDRIRTYSLAAERSAAPPSLDDGETWLEVRRDGHAVRVDPMTAAEHAMLDALQAGYCLAGAHEYAMSMDGGFDLAAFLRVQFARGVFVGFTAAAS